MVTVNPFQPGAHDAARAAVIMGESATVVSFGDVEARSRRYAHLLRAAGLQPGDHVAILMENHERYFEVFWGAQRIGLSTTPINWHLKADEAGYIIEDCGAVAVVTSARLSALAERLEPYLGNVRLRLMVDGTAPGWQSLRGGDRRAPGRSARRRGRRVVDVLLVGHDRAAEGDRPAARRPIRSGRPAARSLR